MAIIPADEKVFMVDKRTNTVYGGSAALQAMQEWYTMQDVADSVQPYKVFTALLTQNGSDNNINVNYTNQIPLVIGQTYLIESNSPIASGGTDFTNVGALNNEVGTYFIATATTVTWGTSAGGLDVDLAAPVATVLENTIGNIWFTYDGVGNYSAKSSDLFLDNKTTLSINLMGDDTQSGLICLGNIESVNKLAIYTGTLNSQEDNTIIQPTPIEIRVYN